ncbi:MAG TPA: beta-ketoacyl-ACP synthase III [Chloroflexia bacterium]|jgi:3-oxoacyl-[acyl-carrier-protein] synthase-3|nr:beta-ketoacyl-ACP synthase III [Chloroflexia bacterium]
MVVKNYAAIRGWGMYAPERVMSNDEMATFVETSDEWIRSRTGIAQRHILADDETTSTLATHAARQALAQADLPADQLDLIIVATCTPDYLLPSTACLVQEALGAKNAAAFDLGAVCSGFMYALVTGTQFVQTGNYRNVLVVGAESLSRFLNFKDRTTCVLFGDGAGAVVLQANESPAGVLSFVLNAQGSGADLIKIPAGGSAAPGMRGSLAEEDYYIHMSGGEVYQFAVRTMSDDSVNAVRKAGLTLDDIDLIIPHQANIRIIEAVSKRIDFPMSKFFANIDRMGNTSAASIPMALCEAVAAGRARPGANLVFVGFGSGLTSGATVVRWGWDG